MALQHDKARERENFPVASWLLPARAREQILAFYDFARGADDIADHPAMSPTDKARALEGLDDAIIRGGDPNAPDWAQDFLIRVKQRPMIGDYGRQLLKAFQQDVYQSRYASLDELLGYCALSAVPVGRMVRSACGDEAISPASDALCVVLQLLNHLQDLQSDYLHLNRVYLPQDWMKQAGATDAMLGQSASSEALQVVIHQLLDVCQQQLEQAHHCYRDQSHWRVRGEIAFIWQIAWALCIKLRHQDPLSQRVALSKSEYLRCAWRTIQVVIR